MRAIVSILLALSLSAMAQVAHAGFSNNSDGTVTDLSSSLMWQRCSAPSEETNCSVSPLLYVWDDALAYCNGLGLGGYTDWRLPNIKELHSIIDATKTSAPNINISYFPDTKTDNYYWSSTTFADTTGYAWYVDFNIGGAGFVMTSPLSKTDSLYARCLRGG